MTVTRQTHKTNMESVEFFLETFPEDFQQSTDRILSGDLDGNLVVIFNSCASYAYQLGCLRYFFDNASAEEVIDYFVQASQASTNMFRLLGPFEES